MQPKIYFVRSKQKVEIDFLIELSNQRFLAIEVKTHPVDLTSKQINLLDSLSLNIVDKWIVTNKRSNDFTYTKVVPIDQIFDQLNQYI